MWTPPRVFFGNIPKFSLQLFFRNRWMVAAGGYQKYLQLLLKFFCEIQKWLNKACYLVKERGHVASFTQGQLNTGVCREVMSRFRKNYFFNTPDDRETEFLKDFLSIAIQILLKLRVGLREKSGLCHIYLSYKFASLLRNFLSMSGSVFFTQERYSHMFYLD